jgi:hypothetical protein
MPATQRGHVRRLPSGRWQLRYYDADGKRQTGGAFLSRTAALDHYRDVIAPRLNGARPTRELTFSAFVEDVYLPRHAKIRAANTIRALRERLARPLAAYGDVALRDLERMSDDLADFRMTLPERFAHDVMRALRQRAPPPCAGTTWARIPPSPPEKTRSQRRGQFAPIRSPSWTRSKPSSDRPTGRSSRLRPRRGYARRSGCR